MRKKRSILFVCCIVVVCLLFALTGCKKKKTKPEKAFSDKKNRYITIINGTETTINKVLVFAGKDEDIEIDRIEKKEELDEYNIAVKIPKEYKDKNTFTVTIYDVYDLKYSKTVNKVAEKGNTEVKITEDDYEKRDGDWKRLLDKRLNE